MFRRSRDPSQLPQCAERTLSFQSCMATWL